MILIVTTISLFLIIFTYTIIHYLQAQLTDFEEELRVAPT